ncbi:hypothetical protein EIP91_003567 [Steccherinum ochraceum]|uniref:Uncharacterized protein n=1 Tax=Steccherinum ochraceum TaxID=92696 RepID=A0A4R0RDS3_9APHY|nr:hypothetical protein EIP91_003567 [Steccherinum ochraceum]
MSLALAELPLRLPVTLDLVGAPSPGLLHQPHSILFIDVFIVKVDTVPTDVDASEAPASRSFPCVDEGGDLRENAACTTLPNACQRFGVDTVRSGIALQEGVV